MVHRCGAVWYNYFIHHPKKVKENMSNKLMFAALAAACTLAATADTLVFKSGSRLEGEVVRITGGEVTFKSDDVGEVKVKLDKLSAIDTKKSATVQYNDRSRRDGVVAMKDGKYTLNKEELDIDDVKAVNPEEEAWHGSLGFSGTAARGNTVTSATTSRRTARAATTRRRPKTASTSARSSTTSGRRRSTPTSTDVMSATASTTCSTATAPVRVSATSGLKARRSSPPANGPSTRKLVSPTSRRSTSIPRMTTAARSVMRTTLPGRPAGSTSSPSRTIWSTCPT